MNNDPTPEHLIDQHALFELAPIGYFVLGRDSTIVDVNQFGADLLKTDRSALQQKPLVAFVPNENQDIFLGHLRRVFSERSSQSAEIQIVDRTGRRVWGQFESRPQTTRETNEHCFTAVLDMTERRRMEDDLVLAREDAVRASRAKSMFLANMSHEIRTPMNGIVAMAELALATDVSEDQRQYLTTIYDSANNLMSMINDVLDFSRIETERVDLHREPFDLDNLVAGIAALYRPQIESEGLFFVTQFAQSAMSWYHGDVRRIRQVLNNLLSNAVKFTESGQIVFGAVAHTISPFMRELTFVVRDTGVGISEEKRTTIFESFTQGDESLGKRFQGTGLGLAMSRKLAKLMGGQLYFESRLGEGSTFYFSIPVHTAEPHEARQRGTRDEHG